MAETNFLYNAGAGRYVDKTTGRFISRKRIRAALDTAWDNAAKKATVLADQLREGAISLADWELSMRRVVKDANLYGSVAGKGGWAQMSQADFGRAGSEIKKQYKYLNKMSRQIEAGEQLLDGTLRQRAQLYAQAGRHTFHLEERREMGRVGFNEERNVLDPGAVHCDGCVQEQSRGWVKIGDLIPIGERDCNMNDRCAIEYR